MKYPNIQAELTGARIQRTCRFQGITVREIQQYLGLSCPQSIYRWFHGKALPSLDHMYALAGLLGIGMDQLVMGNRLQPRHRLYWYCLLIGLREKEICRKKTKFLPNPEPEERLNQLNQEFIQLADWTTSQMTKEKTCDII